MSESTKPGGNRVIDLCEYANGTWWVLDDDDPARDLIEDKAAALEAAEAGIRKQERHVETLLTRVETVERERGIEEHNAQRWMIEAEDWKARAEILERERDHYKQRAGERIHENVFAEMKQRAEMVEARVAELEERLERERQARKAVEKVNAGAVLAKRTNLEAIIESQQARVAELEAALLQLTDACDRMGDRGVEESAPKARRLLDGAGVAREPHA